MSLLYSLILGAIIGWLAGVIMKGGGFGLIGDIVVGIVGSLIGSWVFGMLGVSSDGSLIGSLVTGVIGAIILLFAVRLIKRS